MGERGETFWVIVGGLNEANPGCPIWDTACDTRHETIGCWEMNHEWRSWKEWRGLGYRCRKVTLHP